MPLKIQDMQIDAIPDPSVDEEDPYHWLCSICQKQLEVDWRGVETRPVTHTLADCLKHFYKLLAQVT